MATVKRKIHFFGINCPDGGEFSVAAAAKTIGKLPFASDKVGSPNSRYMESGEEGHWLAAWVGRDKEPIRMMLGNVRSTGLPSLDDHGSVTPLEIGDKSIVELTHCVFFPTGIVGVEFNFHGPRASRFAGYFAEKCPSLPTVKLGAILNKDAASKLRCLGDIRLLHLRVFVDKLPNDDAPIESKDGVDDGGLFALLKGMADSTGADNVEVILRPQLYSQDESLGDGIASFVKGLVGWKETSRIADIFKIEGQNKTTGKREAFDLLADKFVAVEEVVKAKEKYRSVDSNAMYRAIESAYNRLENELLRAARIEL